MKKWDKRELIKKYPIRNFEFRENYVIGYGDAIGILVFQLKLSHSTKQENMILGIVNGKMELHGQVTMRIKMFYFVG